MVIVNQTIATKGNRTETFSQPAVLRANDLEPPEVTRLFEELKKSGLFPDQELPSTMEEATKRLANWMKVKNSA